MNKKPICIMLSAVGQDKITRKAIELGAEYYVVKPFDMDILYMYFSPSNSTCTID